MDHCNDVNLIDVRAEACKVLEVAVLHFSVEAAHHNVDLKCVPVEDSVYHCHDTRWILLEEDNDLDEEHI
jgi:hypothetical protein